MPQHDSHIYCGRGRWEQAWCASVILGGLVALSVHGLRTLEMLEAAAASVPVLTLQHVRLVNPSGHVGHTSVRFTHASAIFAFFLHRNSDSTFDLAACRFRIGSDTLVSTKIT